MSGESAMHSRGSRKKEPWSESLRLDGDGSGSLGSYGSVLGDEEGSATAEYAIATMAAVGFAGLLVVILKGDEVRGILTDLVTRALTAAG